MRSAEHKFGFLITGALTLFAGIAFVRHGEIRIPLIASAGLVLLIALLMPRLLYYPNKAWILLGECLGKVSSFIILFILFYLVFFPLGQIMRIVGKRPLRLSFEAESKSYWINREKAVSTMEDPF